MNGWQPRVSDGDPEMMRARMEVRAPRIAPRPESVAEPRRFSEPILPWTSRPELVGKRLSEREIEVLCLIRDGATNIQLAGALGISEQTAKNHMSRILAKLDVLDRTSAVVQAGRLGIIRLDVPLEGISIAPIAAYSGRGRPPTKCERHVTRRVA